MPQPKVFLSYSHVDERWKERLAGQLQVLGVEGLLEVWDDRRIAAGASWEQEIGAAIDRAQVAVLLISQNFLTSRFVRDVEIPRLLARRSRKGMQIVPVIVSTCPWREVAWLAALQVRPPKGRALASFSGDRVNREMTAIAVEIRALVHGIRTPGTATQKPRLPGQLIWNIPYNRNRNFTGRDHLLDGLRTALASGRPAALTQVMTGLGGVGKTQTAVEYAYRFSAEYELVWWVRAEEATKLAIDYVALASELKLPEKDAPEQFDPAARSSAIVNAVRLWLRRNGGWLLIFDNAQGSTDVRNYLPQEGTGHVIVTSRNPNWQGMSTFPVDMMERNESVNFLLKRTQKADEQAASKLAEALGDLPLALEQAGAYIEETNCSIAHYATLFAKSSQKLMTSAPAGDYLETVAKTWKIAFEQVKKESPAAEDLLSLCAFLAPDEIPLPALIRGKGRRHLPGSLAKAIKNPGAFDKVVASLRRYSLVKVSEDRLVSVHRLVQAVGRARLTEEDIRKWAEIAVLLLSEAFQFDSDDVRTWPACSTLLPHVLAATGYAKTLQVALEETGGLLTALGKYSVGRAKFAKAKAAFEQALAIDEKIHGPDDPRVAEDATNLGFLLKNRGELRDAKKYFERALQINMKVYGANEPEVAISLNNIGLILKDLGDLKQAQKEFERALEINTKKYGSKHPEVAVNLNNLGYLRKDKGDIKGAQVYFERALKINEAAHGADGRSVATNLNNLGIIFKDKGDTEHAQTYFKRALAINEAAYGPNHPQVVTNLYNLGYLMKDKGDVEGARLYFTRALGIYEEAYGRNHPNVTSIRKNLRSLGKQKGGSKARGQTANAP